MASLFSACKTVVRNQASGTLNIGGYDIGLELYHQSDIDTDVQYGDVAFGDDDESKIVVVSDDTITVPEGYILTPDHPKKSLVLFCNNLINNGTISMYQKAPNVLPHDYFIIEKTYFNSNKDLVIPAYANNAITYSLQDKDKYISDATKATKNGQNGIDRQCGSGGLGCYGYSSKQVHPVYNSVSGSGYAFGGGAGTGASIANTENKYSELVSVDPIYPMRGGNAHKDNIGDYVNYLLLGGVGNPVGARGDTASFEINNNFGCGGRVIIFCCNFTNNGVITVNGTNTITKDTTLYKNWNGAGGASGAGAVDLFYTNLIEQGSITAQGGEGTTTFATNTARGYVGAGGDGSITLSQWTQSKVVKETVKYFSRSNVDYLLTQMAERIKESRIGE